MLLCVSHLKEKVKDNNIFMGNNFGYDVTDSVFIAIDINCCGVMYMQNERIQLNGFPKCLK